MIYSPSLSLCFFSYFAERCLPEVPEEPALSPAPIECKEEVTEEFHEEVLEWHQDSHGELREEFSSSTQGATNPTLNEEN